MKKFWWIIKKPLGIVAAFAIWLDSAIHCGKRWGTEGVVYFVGGPIVIACILLILAILLAVLVNWYKDQADKYDRSNTPIISPPLEPEIETEFKRKIRRKND